MYWPTKNIMNQTSSFFFHLSLGHKNNEWRLELSLGQTIGCWWDNFLKVAMTSSIGQLTRSLCQFAENFVILILQILETLWQNLKTKLVGTYTKENSSKSTFLSSKHLLMKKFLVQKYPNHILNPTRDVGWQIGYISIFYCSWIKKTIDFFIDFPRLALKTWSVASSPVIFISNGTSN